MLRAISLRKFHHFRSPWNRLRSKLPFPVPGGVTGASNRPTTDRSDAPFMMSHEAKVCRESCHVKSLIYAVSRAVRNAFLTSWTGSPAFATHRVRERVRTVRNALVVQRLERCEHRHIEGQRVKAGHSWSAECEERG